VQQVRSDHGRGCDGGGEILSYSRAMAGNSGDRSAYFEAIEAKHGEPVDVWLDRLKASGETTYPAQMALLRDRYKFSRTHANAVVMWFRGSTTSQRFDQPESYFLSIEPEKALLMKRIFDLVLAMRSDAELVIAWNQPMVRSGTSYVLGISALKAHLTINPFSAAALTAANPYLTGLVVKKHTFQIPLNWEVNLELVDALVSARLAEIDADGPETPTG
jgi:uncharacterized protein